MAPQAEDCRTSDADDDDDPETHADTRCEICTMAVQKNAYKTWEKWTAQSASSAY